MIHENSRGEIQERLAKVEERLEREMWARGFDPGQLDNLALPANLAKLYAEREMLREMIEDLKEAGDENFRLEEL